MYTFIKIRIIVRYTSICSQWTILDSAHLLLTHIVMIEQLNKNTHFKIKNVASPQKYARTLSMYYYWLLATSKHKEQRRSKQPTINPLLGVVVPVVLGTGIERSEDKMEKSNFHFTVGIVRHTSTALTRHVSCDPLCRYNSSMTYTRTSSIVQRFDAHPQSTECCTT